MPFLAKAGGLAILAGAGVAVFFFGGYYGVAGTAEDPAVVTWALTRVRTASIDRHALDQPPASINDPASVQAGAKALLPHMAAPRVMAGRASHGPNSRKDCIPIRRI